MASVGETTFHDAVATTAAVAAEATHTAAVAVAGAAVAGAGGCALHEPEHVPQSAL
jgi:hypothetical protein